MAKAEHLALLVDRWDEDQAAKLDEPGLLQYRSNLLGSDLRITNFGGGNTSSKLVAVDPIDGRPKKVLWVKGSGGDLGSIKRSGFATLYLDKILALEAIYSDVNFEDEMAEKYPLCTFGPNPVAASIDTPLHAFLPFPHVDHLHPDWAIALAASANGHERMNQFNREYDHNLIWIPWQRPGFELAMMMQRAVQRVPETDGIILGGHGLFTWGETQRDCYLGTLRTIDQLGQFVISSGKTRAKSAFGGAKVDSHPSRHEIAMQIMPRLRGKLSIGKRYIGTFSDTPEVLEFVNSVQAERLSDLGTSCPDHFIRTKIRPMFLAWNPNEDISLLREKIDSALERYIEEYGRYYATHTLADSPPMRDPNPTVVLVPGLGMFTFGKNKTESRLTGEFYINAIHVMQGAAALSNGKQYDDVPQACAAVPASKFAVHENYVALPPSEAFRIEYWQLEDAKIRRQPAEKELSRRIVLVVGGGSGIGRETASLAAERGAHVVVADRDAASAQRVAQEIGSAFGKEVVIGVGVDIRDRTSIRAALNATVNQFGGLDILINTAAIFIASTDGVLTDAQWASTLEVNVTANYLLADEAFKVFEEQSLDGTIVLTSSANAVVAKRGTEAYDVSKAALSHLVRELAVTFSPRVRVNGISPATVIKGSTMFSRERVIYALNKYAIAFEQEESDDDLRKKLAAFYAKRTLTDLPIEPRDCAQAILFLAGPLSRCTTGHLIPVDGGLTEAYLR